MEKKTIHQAWLECQQEFENPKRTAPANWGEYVPLTELLNTFLPILHRHNFSLRHDCDGQRVWAIATYAPTGEVITSACPIAVGLNKMTDIGAAMTYGRRYSAGMLFGIEGEKDLDAKTTSQDPGDFLYPFKNKDQGKKLREMTPESIQSSFIYWMDKWDGKPGMVEDFLVMAESFMPSLEKIKTKKFA